MSFIKVINRVLLKEERLINTDQIVDIEKTKGFKKISYRVRLSDDTTLVVNEEDAERIFSAIGNRL